MKNAEAGHGLVDKDPQDPEKPALTRKYRIKNRMKNERLQERGEDADGGACGVHERGGVDAHEHGAREEEPDRHGGRDRQAQVWLLGYYGSRGAERRLKMAHRRGTQLPCKNSLGSADFLHSLPWMAVAVGASDAGAEE